MALDAVGLLDALELDARPRRRRLDGRHDRPDASPPATRTRMRSLTSIMSNTGARFSGQPR